VTRVVILAPVDNSPYSRAVTALCHAEPGVEVAGVIVRKILNPGRIRMELRRDGIRLVRKAWKKLVLGSEDGVADDEPGFTAKAEEAGIGSSRLSEFARRKRIPCIRVEDHNDERSLSALAEMRPDVVAFTGGGIIRKPLLEAAGRGIFNAHMGMLPSYRGMDVVEWPILEGHIREPGLGVTLHFMDSGIDTGPIAIRRRVPIRRGDSVEQLRKRYEPVMVDLILDGVRGVRDGTLRTQPQAAGDGRQYFIMHPRFYDQVRRKLEMLTLE
jgi:methionyl-tRNA formyltransferase